MAVPRAGSLLALAALAILSFPVTTIAALAAVTGHWPAGPVMAQPPRYAPAPVEVRVVAIDEIPGPAALHEADRLARDADRLAGEAAAMADQLAAEAGR